MINHLAVGALGQEEVVVTVHDDGDVTAFYTKEIADYIRSRFNTRSGNTMSREGRNLSSPAPSRCKVPTPFFKENVGRSAWGLAIHQQSRLIAVSSDRSEITVFAPALKAAKSREQPCDCDVCCQGVEDKVRRRARNWRIVVVHGSSFSKLPNIDFVDDEHGNADKVTAIDSTGAIWLANIWKPEQAAIRLTPSSRDIMLSEDSFSISRPSQGWGILPLANKYFLTVHSEEELFGTPFKDLELLPKAGAGWNPTVSIYRYNRALPDNPCVAPPRRDSDIPSDEYLYSADLRNAENDVEYEDDHDLVFEDAPFKSIYTYNDEEDIVRFPAEFKIYDHESYQDEQKPEEEENYEEILDWIFGDGDHGDGDHGDGDHDDGDHDEEPPPPGTAFDGDPLNALLGNNVSEWTFEHTDEPDYMSDVTSPSNFESQVELPTMSNEEFHNPWVNLPSVEGFETHSESSETSDDQQGSFSTCLKKTPTHDPSTHQNMTYMPHNGVTCITPTHIWSFIAFLQRPVEQNENQWGRDSKISELAQTAHRYHMLRLYEKDFEMQPLDRTGDPTRPPEYSVICPRAIRMGRWSGGDLRLNFIDTARLSMVSHIPELFLIVIGSPMGRVMLATPTRLARPIETAGGLFHYGLRLEWVLPRKSDEAVFRTRKRPLHGMAVGPVQGTGVMSRSEGRQQAALTPKRYRLMLHYRNHDIFTYELSREEETDKVCIF
ncbi:hypothetical protein E4U17_001433 [Claviceps sp. LM77 group G4]|nr:hypothetical protein E4U17_001433 [Claviceps sp. LM77 group G4]KAG6045220.1 hypothetical protein E4U33_001354 [Claviceps sp. LM78 group G4]